MHSLHDHGFNENWATIFSARDFNGVVSTNQFALGIISQWHEDKAERLLFSVFGNCGPVAVDTGQHRRKHQMQNYFRIPLLLLKELFKATNAILNVGGLCRTHLTNLSIPVS